MSKVVYRKNGGRRRAGYPLLVLCAVLLFGFSLVNIVWPKRTQLELGKSQGRTAPGVQRERTAGRQLAEWLCPLDAGSVLPA